MLTGNLGSAILRSLVNSSDNEANERFGVFTACVHSQSSEQRLTETFAAQVESGKVVISRGDNAKAVQQSDIIILGVDPADVQDTLQQESIAEALQGKLLISVAAGWKREKLESLIPSAGLPSDQRERTWVLRVLPNIAAVASESLTAIEEPHRDTPSSYIDITDSIFKQIGETVRVAPRLMNAATAVGGSTPAFFAVICDALIDASVAVGVPRATAQAMIYQSMKGTAAMLQSGMHPGILKDQGTSPEGCTIGGLMVLEEAGTRGHIGRALREAVTIARLMESEKEELHVNDTRQ